MGDRSRSGADSDILSRVQKYWNRSCFSLMSLLSALEDDAGHGHSAKTQTDLEHFWDAVSWIGTRSRSGTVRSNEWRRILPGLTVEGWP